ncbi:hypothetical protein BKA66DRAFT_442486 [Pyrenochaeta sp. MPI-SDFR-AT-0127]|nr:hypothetical protein BKA66DRAFT_442486 [Pyrenochaeta sp. MPI-SDFR-AT-0127]
MADRRGVRSASRRKTPTPQSPSKVNPPQPGRALRTRGLRSASHGAEHVVEVQKPARRSVRQASVNTVTDESDREARATSETIQKVAKEPVGDLTVVEEIDTLLALGEVPGTPTLTQPEEPLPFRSPGAASEMSGTTAISSFSMVEAEFLDPKYMVKHLRKLCDSADEFLEYLAPENGTIDDDMHNIREIQKPDSDFTEEYRDFDVELNVHLKHFKSEEHNYIHIRAIHRALFHSIGDAAAAQSGLDLILYLTNLVIFTKQMIHSDRGEKYIWDALRQLDNSFPSNFMRSLVHEEESTLMGQSKLVDETYNLALDLRTQLAILVLQRSYDETKANSDEIIEEVFFRSDFSQEEGGSPLRGWGVSLADGAEAALPPTVQDFIIKRIHQIRQYFPADDDLSEQGTNARLDDLANDFPWVATVMRILHWVRLRRRELQAVIDDIGGATAILSNVKDGIEGTQPIIEQVRVPPVTRESPRKKQTSFSRDRRRSSRKFNPNAPVDLRTIDALKAKESHFEVDLEVDSTPQEQDEQPVEQAAEEALQERTLVEDQRDDSQPEPQDDKQEAIEQEVDEQIEVPVGSGPPANSADLLKALKAVSNPQKENRPVSIFDRQTTAQRVEFGDGFDETQPTPGPSNKGKGKQPAQPSTKKRSRPIDLEDDSDDDAFEAEERGTRRKAPVAKKVRIDPTSSGVPPSHQPHRRRKVDNDYVPVPQGQEESVSEAESPDMTEEAPPSTYRSQHRLAQQNSGILRATSMRKPRTGWSNEEEEAFAEYMAIYPAKYATILQYDKDEGNSVLQDRTQVNLKDKARTMAINMIKSGTGLKPGFEDIVKSTNKDGRMLIENGFTW